MTADLLIVSRKWSTGRGQYTSIERFCELLDPAFPSYNGERLQVPPRISGFFKNRTNSRVNGQSIAPYNSYSFELELWGLKKAVQNHPRFVFFPYADYDYYYFQYFRKITQSKLVLWSFFSVNELQTRFRNLDHFAAADLVLAAGRDQVACISAINPRVRTAYFPIGVDTDFFTPVRKEAQSYRIVQVGANRRDFDTLIEAMDQLYTIFPRLMVDIIGAYTVQERIPTRPYLVIHPFIEDEQLRSILQQADLGVLCLADGGSSNSLLEMMACGLPVVVTDLENIRDYLEDDACLRVPKGTAKAVAHCCRKLLEDERLRSQMSVAARKQAEKYSWRVLKTNFEMILREFID